MKMSGRAFSVLEIKSVDEGKRVIRGTATTPEPDRMGDIVESIGMSFKNPMPLLWQHKSDKPVGLVKFDKPTKTGITFEATLAPVEEAGTLKDRVDEAWQSVKYGLVRAVSIGFRSLEHSFMEDGGVHFLKSECMELSLVTIPANASATIQSIKSFDAEQRAASGRSLDDVERPTPPASGKKKSTPVKAQEGKNAMSKKSIADQISAFVNLRAEKSARMDAIMDEASDESQTLNAEQKEEYDNLEVEVKEVDEHLVRLRAREKANKDAAAAVAGGDMASAAKTRAGEHITRVQILKKDLPKGIPFVRYVGALVNAKGNRFEAAEFAKRWRDSTPEIEAILRTPADIIAKTAVEAGNTTDSTWAEPLVQYNMLASEFINFLRPLTIIGRINGFRRVPFKIKVPRQTAGASVNWVGESKVKPLTSLAFDSVTMEHYKIAGIIPMSEELVRFSDPSAEMLVRDDLAAAITQFMDSEFIDPTKAEASGVSPASITNGLTAVAATGTTAAALRADVKSLFEDFFDAELQVAGGVWIMTQTQALAISLMQTSLGTAEFPGVTPMGGTFLGFPVVTSNNIPATGSSPVDGYPIIFALPGEIMLADDGGVSIDMSREASLQMETAPDSPVSASTTLVSLWQHNLVAIKAERFMNWKKRRDNAVGYISHAKYAE